MKSKAMKMLAYLAVVLMLFSVLPAGALAAEDDDGSITTSVVNVASDDADQNMTRDQIRVRINATNDAPRLEENVRNKVITASQIKANAQDTASQYRSAKERIVTVRNDYADAKKDFQDLKIKINNKKVAADSEEASEATRAYMTRTMEYMITHLETVKENAENTGGDSTDEVSETIEGYIEQLQQQQANVEFAQTRQEFAEAAKEVRNIWNDAQKSAKYFAGQSVNERLNNVLAKSEGLSLRLEGEINRLKAEGENTEELEEMLAEYNELIEEAKLNHERARETIQTRNGQNDDAVSEADQHMRQATKNIQDANGVLKDMFDELKSHRRGSAVLDGTGTLTAEGSGTAVLSGDLTLNISATNAKLVIKDLAGDAVVTIDGEYTEVDCDDEDDGNRALVYHNLTGTVEITGSRLTVMVHGDDVSITAEGKGSVILSGIGTYKVEKAGESSENVQWAVVTTPEVESEGNEAEDNDSGAEDDSGDADDEEEDGNESDSDDTLGDNETDENETEDDDLMGDE